MATERPSAGHVHPPTEIYEVSRAKIREFAEAVGADSPAHVDPAAARALGHPEVIAPATFPFLVVHRASSRVLSGPEWGLADASLVHTAQRIVPSRPVRAGDRLAVTLHVESVRRLAGRDVVQMRGEVRTDDGEHVVDTFMTFTAGGPNERKTG
ncbi:MaoC family dehydratase N-terminal domain-containing protein [Streptomyces sp. NPDC048506]|uniref:FAS1-like dehydratase domain-containing protein n=1 Tax=Streptomyces sp. NPDC048506 TaxID=3155028 RepID=UPI003419742C